MEIKKLKEFFLKTTPNPSFLLFKAEWCGGCRGILPLVKRYCNKNNFFFYPVDSEDEDSSKLLNLFDEEVQCFPTLMVIIDGEVKHFLEGGDKIKKFLNS